MAENQWHSLTIDQVVQQLGTSLEGLASDHVPAARQQHGANSLPPPKTKPHWQVLVAQFRSALIYILLIAMIISFLLGEWQDATVVMLVVTLNAFIGYRQEIQASQAMTKLLQLSPQSVHVLRDGREQELRIDDVVVGDVLIVETGDRIAADGRWIEALNLRVNEASLTGESVPVSKLTDSLDATVALSDRRNMAWRGTTVVAGRGRILVTEVGIQTRFGAIVARLQAMHEEPTPFQQKLTAFSKKLALFTLVVGLLIFALGIVRDLTLQQVFLLSVSMVVSIIPEGLPVVMTMAMAWGMWEMARRQVLVRKLVAVETLGAVTIVATDKTGTLTYGEMMVAKLWVNGQTYRLTGEGYRQDGDIFLEHKKILAREEPGVSLALRLGALNNDSRFTTKRDGTTLPIGDPTELALVVAAAKGGWPKSELEMVHPRQGEFPFDYRKKYMVTWHQAEKGKVLVVLKGAPQEVLKLCSNIWQPEAPAPLHAKQRSELLTTYEGWATEALRGLAIAFAEVPSGTSIASAEALSEHFTFVGLFGIEDALRPEAKEALQVMQGAGIRTLMVTGDYQQTGIAVAQRLGMMAEPDPAYLLDGGEMESLSESALRKRLATARVGTRLTPEHKLRIAELLKQDGEITAMTGDGINDVPALLKADVGIAVGRQSSDAAKEAADLILVDGNYQSIAAAIGEGRRIFRNIRRVIVYLLASNFGELGVILASLFAGWPIPLLPTQIIWLNAVTDPFLGIALAREPKGPMVMRERPQDPRQSIITRSYWQVIIVGALLIALGTLAVHLWGRTTGRDERDVFALTVTSLAIGQWMMAFNLRSSKRSIFSMLGSNTSMLGALGVVLLMQSAILYIPFLSDIFNVAPLSLTDWLIAASGAVPVVAVEEIRKIFVRRKYVAHPHPQTA